MDISYSLLRQNLKNAIEQVTDKHEPLFITSHKIRKAVVLSYEDYESLSETAYLLQNPVMATRLLKAVQDVKQGKMDKHGLISEK